jgi:hypothetical protein
MPDPDITCLGVLVHLRRRKRAAADQGARSRGRERGGSMWRAVGIGVMREIPEDGERRAGTPKWDGVE